MKYTHNDSKSILNTSQKIGSDILISTLRTNKDNDYTIRLSISLNSLVSSVCFDSKIPFVKTWTLIFRRKLRNTGTRSVP